MSGIRDDLIEVLRRACEHVGIDGREAQPMRVGTNALFQITHPPVVVRIGLRSQAMQISQKEIRVAEWLKAGGLPGARPVPAIAQPLNIGGYPVTFWEWIPSDSEWPTAGDLGNVLRCLHALPMPRFVLPQFDPVASIEALLAPADSGDRESVLYLRRECTVLKRAYRQLTFDLPMGTIHGDAHTGNLIRSSGRAILIDFETFALGPREWELVPTAVQFERFGLPESDYRAFAEAYALDVRDWAGYPILRRIREVAITAWLLGTATRRDGTAEEFRMRVAALRGEENGAAWQRF